MSETKNHAFTLLRHARMPLVHPSVNLPQHIEARIKHCWIAGTDLITVEDFVTNSLIKFLYLSPKHCILFLQSILWIDECRERIVIAVCCAFPPWSNLKWVSGYANQLGS